MDSTIIYKIPLNRTKQVAYSPPHTHTPSRRHEARAFDTTVVQRACTHHYATRLLFPLNMYMVVDVVVRARDSNINKK